MARKKQNTRIKEKQNFQMPWKFMLWSLIPVLVIAAILLAKNWLNDGSNLTITNVEVIGELKYSDQGAMKAVIEPFVSTNLHLLNAKEMEEELEFDPWIKSVAITKRWPSELVIEVIEQTPVAFWGDDRLVNHLGEIFDATLESQKGIMPMLYHPDDKGLEMIEKYRQVQHWLKTIPVGVSELSINARGSWLIRLTNSWELEIGKVEQEKRVRRFLVAYKDVLMKKADKVKKIDLRYTNGLAVSWK